MDHTISQLAILVQFGPSSKCCCLGFNFSGVTLPMHTWAEISRISPYMEPGTLSKVLSLPKNDTFISHRAI